MKTEAHALIVWRPHMWKAKGLVRDARGRWTWRKNFDRAHAIVWSPIDHRGFVVDATDALALVPACDCRGNAACPRVKALKYASDHFDSLSIQVDERKR